MIYSPACYLLLVDMTARQKLGQPIDSILRVLRHRIWANESLVLLQNTSRSSLLFSTAAGSASDLKSPKLQLSTAWSGRSLP